MFAWLRLKEWGPGPRVPGWWLQPDPWRSAAGAVSVTPELLRTREGHEGCVTRRWAWSAGSPQSALHSPVSCFSTQLEGWILPSQAKGVQPAAILWSLGSGLAWPMWLTATPPLHFPPLATIGAPGSQPELASRGRSNGGLHTEDDSVREMRKSKGLIKTLKLVPNEVSHRSVLEGSQALSSKRAVFISQQGAGDAPGATPPHPPCVWRANGT